jgi:dihydrodipicolinate synthase/N-acetylneuraminate lyase
MIPDLSGLIVALLTPFDGANRLDLKSLARHCVFLDDQGVRRILINGTTGEFYALTFPERMRLLKTVRRHFPGLICYQSGGDCLKQTLLESGRAKDMGADVIVALPPFYLAHAPQSGIIAYFNAIAKTAGAPFVLYNFPKHTQNPLTKEMLACITHDGLKDSSADLSLVASTPRYFVGSDEKIVECFDAGGMGFVSARANVAPEPYVAIEAAWRNGTYDAMARLQERIIAVKKVFSGPSQIASIKYGMTAVVDGYPGNVRLPLIVLKQEDRQAHR